MTLFRHGSCCDLSVCSLDRFLNFAECIEVEVAGREEEGGRVEAGHIKEWAEPQISFSVPHFFELINCLDKITKKGVAHISPLRQVCHQTSARKNQMF